MKKETKTILQWVREILGKEKEPLTDLKEPAPGVVERLIAKAGGETSEEAVYSDKSEDSEKSELSESSDSSDESDSSAGTDTESCPYMMKRNIVESLQEVRRFAEEHHLAAAMVRALLTLLAEMAVNALRGKVSGTVLAVLLNALNFDKARAEAYRDGEIAGRNAQIMEKHFPTTDDGLPHLASGVKDSKGEDIFSIAKDA